MSANTKHKSGFVNLIGNPNAGKSTLLNALLGMPLAVTNAKAQTTRHRIIGILNADDFQMVLSDTPGIIKPAHALHESMMRLVKCALEDADILALLTTPKDESLKEPHLLARLQKTENIPIIIIINKIDLFTEDDIQKSFQHWQQLVPNALLIPISALKRFNIDLVLNKFIELLPESPAYYPKDTLTDKPERFFVNEIIREKILQFYKKEIPYAVEVETESFLEEDKIIRIKSLIHVERETQKGIIIGHKGTMLKKTATAARKDMESFFGKPIFLEIFVKVNKDWRKNTYQLRRFGYGD